MKNNVKYFEVSRDDLSVQMIKVTFSKGTATILSDRGSIKTVPSTAIKPTNTKGIRLYGKYQLDESKEEYFQQEWDKHHIHDLDPDTGHAPIILPNNAAPKPTFKVVICGSKEFKDYNTLKDFCDKMLSKKKETHDIIVLTCEARGATALGKKYAKERGYQISEYITYWDKDGDDAGYKKNERMLKDCDAVIAFGESPSSRHMVKLAKDAGKPVAVKG